MVRPDERYSRMSARLKQMKSETCSPSISTTFNRCPFFMVKATLLRGGIIFRPFMRHFQGTGPVAGVFTTTVLPGFGCFTKIGEHGIDGARVQDITFPHNPLHFIILVCISEDFKLRVWVEDHRRKVELPGFPFCSGIQPDDEKSFFTNAETEMRGIRIRVDAPVIAEMFCVHTGKCLQSFP